MMRIGLAVEDQLSEAVAEKLLTTVDADFVIEQRFPPNGNQYLKNRLSVFNAIARSTLPILLLTDLDAHVCPSQLVDTWRGKERITSNLLFRVAIRETEAWLLADRETFADYARIPLDKITETPESLQDPKQELLRLIRRYNKAWANKNDLLPDPGSTAKVGLGYNATLCHYVRQFWSPISAATRSPSLNKARQRIGELAYRLRNS